MFRSQKDYRTFLTLVMTYTLDLVGFSIVFPVLAPLLLNTDLQFFSSDTPLTERTTVLGLLYATFGVAQFFGLPAIGAIADHFGRFKIFLWTIAISVVGYLIMAWSIYQQDIALLFLGRVVTGLCSGNFGLAQSATADLTDPHNRSKAFGILIGVGGLGFVAGPWIGGKLANPDWLHGSGAFIFAAAAALINFLMVLFFFVETWKPKAIHIGSNLLATFKNIAQVFHQKNLRTLLMTYLLFCVGWAFYLIFSPTYLVQKFNLGPSMIGDIFAYMALCWFFVSTFLNKELVGKFSLRSLILWGGGFAVAGVALYTYPDTLWPYWIIIPIGMIGGPLAWINLSALLSTTASDSMQGRVMGVSGSLWSLGQIIASAVAGPLAGWNMYSPLLLGAFIVAIAFFYFIFCYRGEKEPQKSG